MAADRAAARMEGGEEAGQRPQVIVHGCAGLYERRQAPIRRQPAHDDKVFRGRAVGPHERARVQVDVRGEPPVELELPLACPAPRLQRGEVQEPEGHGLLQLEGSVAGKEHGSRVGLGNRDVRLCGVARLRGLTPRRRHERETGTFLDSGSFSAGHGTLTSRIPSA